MSPSILVLITVSASHHQPADNPQLFSGRALLLDAGGVLLTEPIPATLDYARVGGPYNAAQALSVYQERFYFPLWSGQLPAAEFWAQLVVSLDSRRSPAEVSAYFLDHLALQPASGKLAQWSEQATLGLLSNHLAAWLRPLLQEADLEQYFTPQAIWISEESGQVKPDSGAFQQTAAWRQQFSEVLFVDDLAKNIAAAADNGLPGILAIPGWEDHVDRWLAND